MLKKRDTVLSLIFILIALFYYYLASQLPQRGMGFGAAFFPRILSYALIVSSVAMILIVYYRGEDEPEFSKDDFIDIDLRLLIKKIAVVVFLTIYTQALFNFGFKIPTFIFLLAMMLLYGERKLKKVFLMSLGFTIFFDVVFRHLFRVPLREIDLFREAWQWIM